MDRRHFLALAAAVPLAGCTNPFGEPNEGRLSLTVQNDGDDSVTAQVTVVDEDGTTYEDVTDEFAPGTARSFDVVVGTYGRHTVTVAGADWAAQLGWQAGVCRRYDGTVRVTTDTVEVAGECAEPR